MNNTPQVQNQQKGLAVQPPIAQEGLASDLVIPYVIITQSTSDAFTQKKANVGDIIRSTTAELLGGPQTPIDFIPLHYPKTEWVIEVKPPKANRYQYAKKFPRDATNETLPWSFASDSEGNEVPEGTPGALEGKRVKILKVFGILLRDIDAAAAEMKKIENGELPDPTKSLLPVVLSFRSLSYDAGKDLCTFIKRAQSLKAQPWRYVIPMVDEVQTNDQGTFYVWRMEQTKTRAVPKEVLDQVKEWAAIVSGGADLRTDDGAETTSAAPSGPSVGAEQAGEVC